MAASDIPVTSLSAGLLIYNVLSTDVGVSAIATKVFPVVSEPGAQLPYVCYRRSSSSGVPVKTLAGADTQTVEVVCYADTYAGSVSLAEAVRAALDGKNATYTDGGGNTLVARSILLTDSEEGWLDDAYMQQLIFTIKLNNY